jgi:MFS family permease
MARDALLICIAAFVRSAAVSLVGVTLAIHLSEVGLSITQIGLLIGLGLVGSSLATIIVSLHGDAWGRRRVLIALTMSSATGYLALGIFTDASILVPLAFVGMLNGMGRDRGAASALEQAVLPATVPETRRTWTLAWYNVTLDSGHALGALAATIPTILARTTDMNSPAAHQLTFLLCAAAMLTCSAPYLALTPRVEVAMPGTAPRTRPPIDRHSKRVIRRLALLFGLDSIGGGFLNSALI